MDKLSSKHIIFIMLGLSIISLETYSKSLIKTSQSDTWIAMIIASVFFLIIYYYIFKICKDTNSYNYEEIYFHSLGKFLGGILILFLLLTLYLSLVECSAVEANSLHTNFLYATPTWFFILMFILPALYSIRKGKITLVIITLISVILIITAEIILIILSAKYKTLTNLFPVLVNGFTYSMLNTVLKTLGLYSFIFASIPFFKDVFDKSKLKKDILLGLLIICTLEIISYIGTIATFGAKRAAMISYPKVIQSQQISYLNFFENGELLIIFQIVISWYIKYILIFYSIIKLLKNLKLFNKYLPFIITFLVAIPSFIISENIKVLFSLISYYSYICLLNLMLIPLIVFTIHNFKYKNT